MKVIVYIAGLIGLVVLVGLVVHADWQTLVGTLRSAGWPLLWLVPYRGLYFLLYAVGWFCLLKAYDPARRAGLGYVFWVTSIREAIDRLLPVASVGGGVAGVRLMRWRGLGAAPVSATIIMEILLTLIVSYAFTALGLYLLIERHADGDQYRRVALALVMSLPVPIITALLLRHGAVFRRLENFLRPLVGEFAAADAAQSLDAELRACMDRWRPLVVAGILQFAALCVGAGEVWFALRLFGHPVGMDTALILESMTQAMRHLAFLVPGGLGVQEATLVLFGHLLGIDGELALAVSMAKRMREILCGIPSLISWQWMEGRRLYPPQPRRSDASD